jgi:Fe-S cluster biogenesis protein NfuA
MTVDRGVDQAEVTQAPLSEEAGARLDDEAHAPLDEGAQAPLGDRAEAPLTDEERAERLDDLMDLIDLIRPAVQADGGDLLLVHADVDTGEVEVMLQGSCSSCAISSTTLQAGVNRILRERLPWVTEVHGDVDESMDWEESAAMGRGGYVPKW